MLVILAIFRIDRITVMCFNKRCTPEQSVGQPGGICPVPPLLSLTGTKGIIS